MASVTNKKRAGKFEVTRLALDPEKPVKVDKWDGNAVKNALDDAAKKFMTEGFGYEEVHALTDIRLAICTVSCCFALAALIYDYLFPFPASRMVLIFCVASYFVLMIILTLFTTLKEKNFILFAIQKDDAGVGPNHFWRMCSTLKRYDHQYSLTMIFEDGVTHKVREQTMMKSVVSWFDEDGVLLYDLLEKDVIELHLALTVEKKDK